VPTRKEDVQPIPGRRDPAIPWLTLACFRSSR
jgi:hypothetical protein